MASYSAIVEKQRRFFKSGKTLPIEFRIEQLKTLKRMLKDNVDKISDAIYKDLHRSKAQAYCYEVSNVFIEIDYMIDNIEEWSKPRPVEKTMMTVLDTPMVKKDPLGVVLIITPWNYPINMAFLPLVPAIAAGNTAIIKPSEIATHCADVIEEMISKYFKPEVISVVKGGVQETSELLKERFDHILYTGAPPVGKIIMAAAAKHLTPVTLELGGKCPVIVEKDADVDIAGKRIAWGKWLNCGQTCLAPDYILTTAEVKPKLVEAMRKAVDEFYGGNPKTHDDYARIINERHFERLSALLDKTEGTVLMGGERDKKDLYIQPTVLDAKSSDAFMQDEIFGPILPILTVKSLDDAIEQIKEGEKPLAAYIFTKDNNKVNRLITETSSGGVTVNDVILHITVDTLPFGGVGNSGMGRYRGKYGFDTFSHEKAILKRGFMGESLMSVRYPPFTSKKFEQLKSLTGGRKGFPKFFKHFGLVPILLLGVFVGMFIQRFMLHHA